MTKVLVTESYLEDIADAIREKLDSRDGYDSYLFEVNV